MLTNVDVYNKQVDTGLDSDASSVSTALVMEGAKLAAFFVVANTGTHATHVITMQVSPDGTNWFDTSHTITGVGNLHNIGCAAEQIRCKVTTLEGATSTVDITIIIK
ncbi:MAG: hypothetical protein JKY98_03935 [Gammaproteobacteria bacterium]|nr:hypothetical protein [Gammaproteobacteria bacterium]